MSVPSGVVVQALIKPGFDAILTPAALQFLARLHREFEPRRRQLLAARGERAGQIDGGQRPDFLPATRSVRESSWQVAPLPPALECRRVEITGPVERKMIINALNSGADAYMADFEDSNTPNWDNQIQGQVNLLDAIRRRISFSSPDGRIYRLNDKIATLLVRPRGWHLDEKHVLVDGERVSGGLFDFALFIYHNGRELAERGQGPFLYLPKLESIRKRACGTTSSCWRSASWVSRTERSRRRC